MQNKTKQENKIPDVLEELEGAAAELHRTVERHGRPVFARYPLTFALLATLGAASVIHGFEGMVEKTPFLAERPILILITGLLVLLFTGTLYRYLRK